VKIEPENFQCVLCNSPNFKFNTDFEEVSCKDCSLYALVYDSDDPAIATNDFIYLTNIWVDRDYMSNVTSFYLKGLINPCVKRFDYLLDIKEIRKWDERWFMA
jgi:hypothetical protein